VTAIRSIIKPKSSRNQAEITSTSTKSSQNQTKSIPNLIKIKSNQLKDKSKSNQTPTKINSKSNEIYFIENSIIHLASQNSMKNKSKIKEQMFMVCDCLGIEKFHGL
jgi:hypothetical protein